MRHGTGIQQILTVRDIDAAIARLPHQVSGTANPLQPSRDTSRRLQLQHGVHGADIDTQFERTGGDQSRQSSRL